MFVLPLGSFLGVGLARSSESRDGGWVEKSSGSSGLIGALQGSAEASLRGDRVLISERLQV